MKQRIIICLFSLLTLSACGESEGQKPPEATTAPPQQNISRDDLVGDLAVRGATPISIVKMIFVGSESDVGGDIKVTITDPKIMQTVWQSIEKSLPTDRWCMCGDRTVEFYNSVNSTKPLTLLKVKETDAAYVEGAARYYYDNSKNKLMGMFKCEGLNDFILKYLNDEYKRRNPSK